MLKTLFLFLTLLSPSLLCPGTKYCRMCTSLTPSLKYTCNQCEHSTFNILTNSCEKTKKKITNCKIYKNSPILECFICKYGFTLINKECIKCEIDNCAICDNDIKNCLGCFHKNIYKNNKCDSDLKCKDKNCDICGYSDTCFRCKNNFSLSKGVCIEGLSNCLFLKRGSVSKCQICDFGYFISRSWKCKPNVETSSKLKCWLKESDDYSQESFLMIE